MSWRARLGYPHQHQTVVVHAHVDPAGLDVALELAKLFMGVVPGRGPQRGVEQGAPHLRRPPLQTVPYHWESKRSATHDTPRKIQLALEAGAARDPKEEARAPTRHPVSRTIDANNRRLHPTVPHLASRRCSARNTAARRVQMTMRSAPRTSSGGLTAMILGDRRSRYPGASGGGQAFADYRNQIIPW